MTYLSRRPDLSGDSKQLRLEGIGLSICYTPIVLLGRRSEEKYTGNYEVEEDTEHVNRGGNEGTRGNGGINPEFSHAVSENDRPRPVRSSLQPSRVHEAKRTDHAVHAPIA